MATETISIGGEEIPVEFKLDSLMTWDKKRTAAERLLFSSDVTSRMIRAGNEEKCCYTNIIDLLKKHGVTGLSFTVTPKTNRDMTSLDHISICLRGNLEGIERFACHPKIMKLRVLPFGGEFIDFRFSDLDTLNALFEGPIAELKR
ncbi:MAG: hypothetical protein HGA67_00035 [Candidatus Yonathbacteria bacterium]|nr:hypothetical protein [Candidatus Yonathbacteria bacterium]